MNKTRKIYISNKRFTEAKKARKFTINKIAEETDCPYDTIKGCLQKEMIMPDILDRISKCLNVAPGYLQGKKMPKKEEVEIQKLKLSAIATTEEEKNHAAEILRYYSPFIDSEGNFVPTYLSYTDGLSRSEAKHGLFEFIDSLVTSKGWSRDFFDKHYDDIYELFVPSVLSIERFIENKTGELVMIRDIHDPNTYNMLESED